VLDAGFSGRTILLAHRPGNGGDGVLIGSFDDDVLLGGRGRDRVVGGRGSDRCRAEALRGCEFPE
jgi:Ca2+-binding RTX toxin-like protein